MLSFLVVLGMTCFLAVNADYKDNTLSEHHGWRKIREDMKICREKFGLPADRESRKSPIAEEQSCYYHCFVQRMGLMDEDGAVTMEMFKKNNPKMTNDMLEVHIECVEANQDYDDKCEKAKEIQMCLKHKFENKMEKFNRVAKECMKEFDIPETGKWSPIPDDKKCYYKCLGVKMDAMNDAGDFTIEKFKVENPEFPQGILRNMEECMKTSKMDDACDSAKAVSFCIDRKSHWK